MEDSNWFPYIFSSGKGDPTGIQVDIVEHALKTQKIDYRFEMLPWKRCLDYVKRGVYDACIGASFNEERAKYMSYPDGAREASVNSSRARNRIAQVEYVIVNLKEQQFEFDGDLTKIPSPIYIPMGFSLAGDLRKKGLEVDSNSKSDEVNFKKLLFRKEGSVVVVHPSAYKFLRTSKEGNYLKISKKRLKSKSNFFSFSNKSKVSRVMRERIWKQISNSRALLKDSLYLKY
jgi:polar amino acid transport system substrate-binding protein